MNKPFEFFQSDPDILTLSEELAKGDCVLVFGSGMSSILQGFSCWQQLHNIVQERSLLNGAFSPAKIADCCRSVLGERRFSELLKEIFATSSEPNLLHYRFISFPVKHYITTSFDTLLEKALVKHLGPNSFNVLTLESTHQWNLIPIETNLRWILKAHGCISRTPEQIIVTESDYLSYNVRFHEVTNAVSRIISKRPLLMVGYGLSDWDLLPALKLVVSPENVNRYFIGVNLEPSTITLLQTQYRMKVINLAAETNTAKQSSNDTLLRFLNMLGQQYELPDWFIETLQDIGYAENENNISISTILSSLFPGFDVTAKIRLALRIEKIKKIQLPLNIISHPNLTVGEFLSLVRKAEAK